jgi:membrane-associated phospholipid phosphatase
MNTMVYENDLPDNLAPSFHVLCTFLPFVACWNKTEKNKKNNCWMILVTGIMFVLVSLSVLFVRQHYIVDIFTAMVIVLLCYAVVRF